MYRTIKELINNTVKHAHASHIEIILEYTENMLTCSYSDNGVGFNWVEKTEAPGKGLGLHNIISRIRSLGGNFQIKSAEKKGFHIRFELQTIIRNDAGKN
jgi:signal transduction histidine kinase